jgi:hypothetical protein
MVAHDRIRLTGPLRKSPAQAGLFYDLPAETIKALPDSQRAIVALAWHSVP